MGAACSFPDLWNQQRPNFSLKKKKSSVITKYILKGFVNSVSSRKGDRCLRWVALRVLEGKLRTDFAGLAVSPLSRHVSFSISCRTIWVIRFPSESELGHFRCLLLSWCVIHWVLTLRGWLAWSCGKELGLLIRSSCKKRCLFRVCSTSLFSNYVFEFLPAQLTCNKSDTHRLHDPYLCLFW